MKNKKRILSAVKSVVFLLLLALILRGLSLVMGHSADEGALEAVSRYRGFRAEKSRPLDAVYIGGSNVYFYWMPAVAWKTHGITVYPLSSPTQSFFASLELMKEARKTQPDALYILGLNALDRTNPDVEHDYPKLTDIHYYTDLLPLSENKVRLIDDLADMNGFGAEEKLELYYPLYRYHSRWGELGEADFRANEPLITKGTAVQRKYLALTADVTKDFRSTEKRLPLSEELEEYLDRLLTYCEEEKVNVLFVTVPWSYTDESFFARLNTLRDKIEARGFPVLDMQERFDEIGLRLDTDFYNDIHTNIHGCCKVTEFLSQYLTEKFGFEDKRGRAGYGDWDEAYDAFSELVSPWAMDFEISGEKRDPSLLEPKLTSLTVSGTSATLHWEASEGADGYRVYRQRMEGSEGTGWIPVGTVDGDTLSWEDEGLSPGTRYAYTAASFAQREDGVCWGFYDVTGLSAEALLDAPLLSAPEGGQDRLTLRWTQVESAGSYEVYRRVAGKSKTKLAVVNGETAYTDWSMLSNVPYTYMVRGVNNETGVVSSYSNEVLYLPELLPPEVSASLEEGTPVLRWKSVEWASGYEVFRKAGDSPWVPLAETLPASAVTFRDLTAPTDAPCVYRLEASFDFGGETYGASAQTGEVLAERCEHPLGQVTFLYAQQVSKNIQLVWRKQGEATAYRVYRRAAGEKWTVIKASTSGNALLNKPPEAGSYEFYVQPLYTEGDCTYLGEFDETAAITVEYRR